MGGAETARPLTPVLLGPTAVGKTAVATALSRLVPLSVVSADARQVYRRLDIGSAKPEPALRAEVPHYGLDLIDPGERYSAGRFARDASAWLAEIRAAGRLPLVVGGTGFYVRALAEGLFREPPLDPVRRERLSTWAAGLPDATLARFAVRLDPRFRGGGRQRGSRALEVAFLTGRPLSWWQREAREFGVMRPWYIVLTLPREVLRRRIADRVDRMLAAGWVDEVQRELARGTAPSAAGLDGIGYREVVAMLQGRLEPTAMREAIITATRRYAKRQDTWLRHQLLGAPVWSLDASASPEQMAGQILERWRTTSHFALRASHS